MNASSTADKAAAQPTSALQRARSRWARRARRSLLTLLLICLAIAGLLTALEGRGFFYKLLYSLCIGTVCMAVVDGVRLGSAWVADRMRSARGLPYVHNEVSEGWRGVVPGSLVAVLIGPAMGLQLADWITGFQSPSLFNWASGTTRVTLVLSLVATVVSVVVLSTAERLSHARAQALAAQREAAENQLRLLQSQLEPHMLFNTLANLRVLIGLDPARAQAMLDRLITFLRATLTASRTAWRPLSAEFQHLDDYLALMSVRMGDRLQVQLDLPTELAHAAVPPLLLQPLVENSIKHGLEPKVPGGRIAVAARQRGETLVLSVRDTGVGLQVTPGPGGTAFGLEQLHTRLQTLYGERARFTLQAVDDAEGGVLALIELPLLPTETPPKP